MATLGKSLDFATIESPIEYLHGMASLFDLPPETRNNIYGLVLTNSSPGLIPLTASSLLYEEAASYFYQNTHIGIDLMDAATTSAHVLPQIPDRYLRYSRVLTVDIRLGYVGPRSIREQAQRLATMADHCTSLTTLTLSLTSNASRVVSSTLDEYVLHAAHPLTLAMRYLLLRGTTRSVRVNLSGVWFAPGTLGHLVSEGRLEVLTSESSIERPMYGRETQDHLRELGLGSRDVEDAEILQSSYYDGEFLSMPLSLNTAVSELDYFSPTGELDGRPEDLHDSGDEEHLPSSDEPMSDMNDLDEGSAEELTEDDDVDDEEMEEIDDIEGIVDNLVQVHQQRVSDKDICYMTNFAPNMLRAWSESLL
ncbi:hypothetical protein E8E12_006019 [Didymella heteroderae]|uniref:Uncharacterized protein n=1 Tax=Didymella heteroderae TaxID=1769908 RepID=A0A9P4WMN7_9PLEO|nr:hypothetical protein E8E12_006019 [Didymella heteroderae]